VYYPIYDEELPNLTRLDAVSALGAELIRGGHRVLSHCGMGFNRSALIAGVIPLAGGHTLSEKTGLGLLAMLAAAMGLQTATLTRIGSLTVHTTFVTGMLNKLAQLLSQALFLSYDSRQGRDTAAALHQVLHRARFMIAIWLLYSIGAATGVWMDSIWRLRSLWLPVGIVSFGMVVDQIWPLSLEEEQDQSET